MATERQYEEAFPWIKWREPLRIERFQDKTSGFACRYCVAMYGLKGEDVDSLFRTEAECRRHIEEAHARP